MKLLLSGVCQCWTRHKHFHNVYTRTLVFVMIVPVFRSICPRPGPWPLCDAGWVRSNNDLRSETHCSADTSTPAREETHASQRSEQRSSSRVNEDSSLKPRARPAACLLSSQTHMDKLSIWRNPLSTAEHTTPEMDRLAERLVLFCWRYLFFFLTA